MIETMETEVKVVAGPSGASVVKVMAGGYAGVLAIAQPDKVEILLFTEADKANTAAVDAIKALREYAEEVKVKGMKWRIGDRPFTSSVLVDSELPGRAILMMKPNGTGVLRFASAKAAEAAVVDFIEALLPPGALDWEKLALAQKPRKQGK